MFQASLLSGVLIICAVAWHYWALAGLTKLMPPKSEQHSHFMRTLGILLLLVSVHLVEVLWFTAGYYAADRLWDLGGFTATFTPIFRDYFYYSLVTYSTLGMSDFTATGHLKVMTGLESLIGFILITWSATFFYNLSSRRP